MSPSLNVMHVVLSLDCGGLERIVLDLARYGIANHQKVTVLCIERPGTLAKEVERAGAKVISMYKPFGRHPVTVDKIQETLRMEQPDVVHTHQVGAIYYAGPAAKNEQIPVIIHTEHINQLAKYKSHAMRAKIRLHWWLTGRMAARFCCVSEDIAVEVRAFSLVPGRKVCVVQNGIDCRRFRRDDDGVAVRNSLGIPIDAPVIGTVGRLDEVKCQDMLIRSFARVRARYPGARLLVVGDGPKREALAKLADSLDLTPAVSFVGYQSQPDRFLHAMDYFVLTSRAEGLPLAILEAWAAGLPVIATRVGGIPKVVENGRTGLLIDPGDEAGLVKGLLDLFETPSQAIQMGHEGRARVEADFDTQRMGRDYSQHYLELLSQRKVSA